MTILKLGKHSPEPGEHPRYPESMSGVPRTDFLTTFQKTIGTSAHVRKLSTTLENGIIRDATKMKSYQPFHFSSQNQLFLPVFERQNHFIMLPEPDNDII